MNPLTRAGILLVFISLAAIGASWHYWLNSMAAMRAESQLAHTRLEATLNECQAAVAAANSALRAREIIHAQTEAKFAQLAGCLGPADSIPVPDSLRSFFQSPPEPATPAASCATATHPPAQP